MQTHWMIRVIEDLVMFADANQMPETAKLLGEVHQVADSETSPQGLRQVPTAGDNFVLFSDFDNPSA